MLTFKANKEQIEIDGLMYYCVYGTYEGGAWLSILNFGVSAELSAMASDEQYNAQKIHKALLHSPDIAWLPQDEQAQKAIAAELSKQITARIQLMLK